MTAPATLPPAGPTPASAVQAVLVPSAPMPTDSTEVKGYDFNNGVDYSALLASYFRTGYQATSVGQAVEEINRMIKWRLSDEPIADDETEEYRDPEARRKIKCKIFLGYTSNLISSGLREVIRYLVEHSMVDCIVASAGGIEEDLIKCLGPTYIGSFSLPGANLRKQGLNRIGNLLVPNDNYCKFEDWVMPILDAMLEEQKRDGVVWTPSKVVRRLGREIGDTESVYYWAWKNNIPVYCPALTDGSLGDMIYFHSYKNPGLIIDIAGDIRAVNNEAVFAKKTGMIILGGGVVKHHICNANLMRNGADYAVYINTGQEFDGSDAGARPDEAVSWGKIRMDAKPVKVYADATVVFPLIVAETFAKHGVKRVADGATD
ncbi:DHS-like NAD/FAD-binding domain-containing protein [Fimicolochytrium jonesii]|uniref:DHS-like NAD/FAD-binding domain-containing protein n=1 Tax=Fimicolochytrium jonesii TaxID=1396493 RepID=UPI0022FDCE96|nr:DHS-like NAD/FAD-binding domain-containing protein [Fimicolochytrium jonesii]KAI8818068.1 DHS-like NAD/FAD-binding domain-containing protein [Fimicolochytrium jonesii]